MLTASGERPEGCDLLIDLSSKITTYQMLPLPMIRLLVRLFVVVQTRTPRQSQVCYSTSSRFVTVSSAPP